MRRSALLSLVCLAAMLLPRPSLAGPLSWAWGDRGSVEIEQLTFHEGWMLVQSYTLRWEPKGAGSVVRWGGGAIDWQRTSQAHHATRPLLDLLTEVEYEVTLDAEGRAVSAKDVAPSLQALAARAPADPPQLRAALTDPLLAARLQQSALDEWSAWAGVWVGRDLASGAPVTVEITPPVAVGTPTPGRATFERLAKSEGGEGTMTLTSRLQMDDGMARRLMADVLAAMPPARGLSQAQLDALLAQCGVEVVKTTEITADAKTLRPTKARTVQRSEIALPDSTLPPQSDRQEDLYLFRWK